VILYATPRETEVIYAFKNKMRWSTRIRNIATRTVVRLGPIAAASAALKSARHSVTFARASSFST
jgi:hypothetical protein